MLFYIILLIFVSGLFLLGYLYPNREILLSRLTFAIMFLVAGLRYEVGGDYDSYVSWYLHKTRDDDFEAGFVVIMDLFRRLKLSPEFLFFFFSFFTCYFVYFGVRKYTVNSNLALLFYILIPSLYLTSFTLVRQSFSVAISFYAFYYLMHRRYWAYFLLMTIGVLIHNSCLIPFVLFLFVYKFIDKIKVKHLFFLLILSLFLSNFDFVRIFSFLFEKTRYAYYFSNKVVPVSLFKIIILNSVAIFVLLYFDRLKAVYPYQKYMLVLYILSVVLINISAPLNELGRVYIYFRIFEIIVVADLIFLEINRRRIILFSFFYVMYFGSFLYALNVDAKNINKTNYIHGYTPYRSVLFE